MTHEAIKAAIEAEAGKRYPLPIHKHNGDQKRFVDVSDWVLSMLPEWGYVKAPETDWEMANAIQAVIVKHSIKDDDDNIIDLYIGHASKELAEMTQAYAEQKVREALAEEEETRRAVDVAHNEQYVKYKAEIDRLKGLVQTAWTSALNDTGLASFDAFKQKHGL